MELQQMTSQQKKEIRILYAQYKELGLSEYPRTDEGRREYLADGGKIWAEIEAICFDVTLANIERRIYSPRQLKFIKEYEGNDGFRWDYGGRFMYGDKCPAIVIDFPSKKEMNMWEYDSMANSTVLYAKD